MIITKLRVNLKILKDDRIEQLLEITRKGTPVEGTVLYKIATDLKRLKGYVKRLVADPDDKKEIKKIVAEAKEYL